MFTEQTHSFGRLSINVAVGPANGPPLLLLHGVTRAWQDFLPIMPALGQRWQLHGLDLRGHGRSGRAPGAYHVIDYAQDVIAWLKQTGTPAVLYGHSLGALVAAAAAAGAPELIRAVVLEDPPAPASLRNMSGMPYFPFFSGMRRLAGSSQPVAELARAFADLPVLGPAGPVRIGDVRDMTALRFSARCLRQLDPEVLTPLVESRWLDGYDVDSIFRSIICPVLLLRADERVGGMLPKADAGALAAMLRDGISIDMPGQGHLLHWAATEAVGRLALGFLESV